MPPCGGARASVPTACYRRSSRATRSVYRAGGAACFRSVAEPLDQRLLRRGRQDRADHRARPAGPDRAGAGERAPERERGRAAARLRSQGHDAASTSTTSARRALAGGKESRRCNGVGRSVAARRPSIDAPRRRLGRNVEEDQRPVISPFELAKEGVALDLELEIETVVSESDADPPNVRAHLFRGVLFLSQGLCGSERPRLRASRYFNHAAFLTWPQRLLVQRAERSDHAIAKIVAPLRRCELRVVSCWRNLIADQP